MIPGQTTGSQVEVEISLAWRSSRGISFHAAAVAAKLEKPLFLEFAQFLYELCLLFFLSVRGFHRRFDIT